MSDTTQFYQTIPGQGYPPIPRTDYPSTQQDPIDLTEVAERLKEMETEWLQSKGHWRPNPAQLVEDLTELMGSPLHKSPSKECEPQPDLELPDPVPSPPSTGTKHDYGKPDYSLLSTYSISKLVAVLDFGKNKYAAHNWRGGIAISRLTAAMLRHTFAFLGGEDNDSETGLPHIAHAMCCAMFIIEQQNYRPELDDRAYPQGFECKETNPNDYRN